MNMIVAFGKTEDDIKHVIDLSLVWTFRIDGNRVQFLKDDDTWARPNLEDIGTPQEVMKYITYALANEEKMCFISTDTIKNFRERFNKERERDSLVRKAEQLKNALAALSKDDEQKTKEAFERYAEKIREEYKDVDNIYER